MLNNLISDLYLYIFQYLNVKELTLCRQLSKYLKQFCYFFSLIDWSAEIDWSQTKISLSDEDYTPEKIQEHNIHNWYKILKHQRQEVLLLGSPRFTWRHRSKNFTKKIIQRTYYNKRILRKITSHFSEGWELLTQDSPVDLYCCRSFNLLTWNIYDCHHQLLAKIKFTSNLLKKEQIFNILRPNNKIWFKIKYSFRYRQPRAFRIYDFKSLPWENSENIEKDLFLSNNNSYDTGRNEEYGGYYRLKFYYIRPNRPSTKNCSIFYQEKYIYEFGRKDDFFVYGYQQPFHGLYAFIVSCCQILV